MFVAHRVLTWVGFPELQLSWGYFCKFRFITGLLREKLMGKPSLINFLVKKKGKRWQPHILSNTVKSYSALVQVHIYELMFIDSCPGNGGNCLAQNELYDVGLNFSHLTWDLVNAEKRRGSWIETLLLAVVRESLGCNLIQLSFIKDSFQFFHWGRALGFIMSIGQTGTQPLIGKLKWFVPKWYNQGGLQSRWITVY